MTNDLQVTPDLVRGLWAHLSGFYHTRVVSKANSTEMRVVASALKLMGVLDAQVFMSDFVTTLWRTIYVPFKIGDERSSWSLWDQITVCVHEHQHVEQLIQDGWLRFTTQYLTSSAKRAVYEAEAYRCDMELWFWKTGNLLNSGSLVKTLGNYNCKASDIRLAEHLLNFSAITVKKGGVINMASQLAIKYLEKHGVPTV